MSYRIEDDLLKIRTWQSLYHLLCLKTEATGKEWFSCQQLVPNWPPVVVRYSIGKLKKLGLLETQGRTIQGLKLKPLPITTVIKHR